MGLSGTMGTVLSNNLDNIGPAKILFKYPFHEAALVDLSNEPFPLLLVHTPREEGAWPLHKSIETFPLSYKNQISYKFLVCKYFMPDDIMAIKIIIKLSFVCLCMF